MIHLLSFNESNSIKITPFCKEDAKYIEKIVHECVKHNFTDSFSDEMNKLYLEYYSENEILKRSEKYYIVVARIDGEIVGTGSIDNQDFITGLYILPKYQKYGVGKHIMNYLIKECKNRNFKFVKINATPTSVNFYKKIGFKILQRKLYITGDEKSDYYEMELSLL